jgi:osmotically-inducible protein OsmY
MDERDRRWRDQNRDRDWRRSDDMGRGDQRRQAGGEERSWSGSSGGDRGSYGGGWRGSDRDRVFGERESGMGYGGEHRGASSGGGRMSGGGRYGREDDRPEWQDRHYQGVSPAMQHGEYDLERRAERFQREHPVRRLQGGGYGYEGEGERGGRYYGDAGRDQIYREEWSQGARDTGPAPRGYDAERDHERGHFSEDYEDRMFSSGVASGGTGGYDYERGYGDGGRQRYSEGRFGVPSDRGDRGERWEQRGREAGRDTGDFFRRAGERVASWFGGGEREQERDWRDQSQSRDFRGKGPKGYKRNDERISDEVHERLTDDPYIDASNINIAVSGGEVTLSGTVEHRDAKHRAERIIEDVSGVSHVQNNLRIAAGGGTSGESVLDLQARGESGSGETMGGGGGLRSTSAGGEGGQGQTGTTSPPRTTGASTDTGKSR